VEINLRWPELSDRRKLLMVVILTAISVGFIAYFRLTLSETSYFADFFYLPILLACFWYQLRGLFVALVLSITLLASDIPLNGGSLLLEDSARVVIFFGIGLVMAFLGMQMTQAQRQLRMAIEELDDRVRERTSELEDELAAKIEAQSALAEEKEKLAVTLQSIGDAVIVADTEGRVVMLNEVAQRLSGHRSEEVQGLPVADILDLVDIQGRKVEDPIRAVLRSGKPTSLPGDTVLLRPDGARIMINDSASPIMKGGHLTGAVMVFTDVTERERMREAAAHAQKLRSMELLAGGVAHDFNNIMTIMTGNIHLARTAASQQEAAHYLDEAEKAGERARELTKQLTSYARTGAPMAESTDIGPLLRETAELHLVGSKVARTYDIAPDLDQVGMETVKVGQVISNLVINAIEAMPKGGSLTIRARNQLISSKDELSLKAGRYVRIEVEDTGTGIPADRLRVIFEPYYSTKERGSGLGLAIVQAIILKHGGSISVRSKEGVGTTFVILLPSAGPGKEAPPGQRLLLVSANAMSRQGALGMLSRSKYRVTACADSAAAVAEYQTAQAGDRYAAVVLDAELPDLEDLLRQLRSLDLELRSAAFNVPKGEGWRMAKLGLWGWSEMPSDEESLHSTIASVLEG
jgi:PAS domain S-box-containing protein